MKLVKSLRARIRWPKTPEAKTEALVFSTLGIVFFLALLPALGYASREHRDGARRKLLREIKTELEQWFNRENGYPLHPSGHLDRCGSTAEPDDWFFQNFLKRAAFSGMLADNDARTRRHPLRYCPTLRSDVSNDVRPLASGFFLEALLENTHPESTQFNTEHNIFERTVTVGGRSAYRICGGPETQCGTAKPPDS